MFRGLFFHYDNLVNCKINNYNWAQTLVQNFLLLSFHLFKKHKISYYEKITLFIFSFLLHSKHISSGRAGLSEATERNFGTR